MNASDFAGWLPPLQNEVAWLFARWHAWRSLFARNEARVQLLNYSARPFFSMIQQSLATDVKVGLVRVLDPARTGKNDNLTLPKIGEGLRAIGANDLAAFDGLLAELHTLCKPLRDERNQRLAHLDFGVALKLSPEPGGIKIQDIDAALSKITKCMTIAECAAGLPERVYEAWATTIDTDGLFRALVKAKEYDHLRTAGSMPKGPRLEFP